MDKLHPKFNSGVISNLSSKFVLNARKLFEKKNTTNLMEDKNDIPNPPPMPYGEIEEIIDGVERNFPKFKNFDQLLHCPKDHYFYNKPYDQDPEFAELIQSEWGTLKECLPRLNIFVRAYASRLHVMRALIVGQETPPYHQGLFFFDIFFPSNYPTDPPQLFYRSDGLDFGPNVPRNGNFSFLEKRKLSSIFETLFSFPKKQKPYSIYETLVSLQQLILTEREKSLEIDKGVFKQTCEGMISMLDHPLTGFEDFVLGYFRTRAHRILLNYKACADLEDEEMKMLFFKLVKAFESNGTYCGHHCDKMQYDLAFKKDIDEEVPLRQKSANQKTSISQGVRDMIGSYFEHITSLR